MVGHLSRGRDCGAKCTASMTSAPNRYCFQGTWESSSLLTDGALARWEASLKLGPRLRAHFGIQESGVAGVQELENLGAWRRFPKEMLGLDFRIKTLLAYSATP